MIALDTAKYVVARDGRFGPRMFAALREPFALRVRDAARQHIAAGIAMHIPGPTCVEALEPYERCVPWDEPFLATRYDCYSAAKSPLLERAERDLVEWRAGRATPFSAGLVERP